LVFDIDIDISLLFLTIIRSRFRSNRSSAGVSAPPDGRGYQHAKYSKLAVFFNADKVMREVTVDELKGRMLAIHKSHPQAGGFFSFVVPRFMNLASPMHKTAAGRGVKLIFFLRELSVP
jgi:hypothetical protein